jgi:hypothetical protein
MLPTQESQLLRRQRSGISRFKTRLCKKSTIPPSQPIKSWTCTPVIPAMAGSINRRIMAQASPGIKGRPPFKK